MIEQEVAHGGEVAAVQQVRRAFHEGVGSVRTELLAEGEEARVLDAAIGEIGAEIVERLLGAAIEREHDLHALRGGLLVRIARDLVARAVDADEGRLVDGRTGAGEEDVDHRQRAVHRPGAQLVRHVLGDEVAELHQVSERDFHAALGPPERRLVEAGERGNVAGRLEARHHVGAGIGKQRDRMQRIRAAEEIEQRVVGRAQALLGERAHPRQVAAVLFSEHGVEAARVRPARPDRWSARRRVSPPPPAIRRETARCRWGWRSRHSAPGRSKGQEGSEERQVSWIGARLLQVPEGVGLDRGGSDRRGGSVGGHAL